MYEESEDTDPIDIAMDLDDVSTLADVPSSVLAEQDPTEAVMTELLARSMPPESRWAAYPENIARADAELDEIARQIAESRQARGQGPNPEGGTTDG